jgi:uncharacterized protein (TIGR00251 family)
MGKPTQKDLDAILHTSKNAIVVDLEVSPASKRPGFTSINPWRKTLCLSVKAPPKKGEANKEVLRSISELFKVPANSVSIISGDTSSIKRVKIEGIGLELAKKAILSALGTGEA